MVTLYVLWKLNNKILVWESWNLTFKHGWTNMKNLKHIFQLFKLKIQSKCTNKLIELDIKFIRASKNTDGHGYCYGDR